MFNDGNNSMKPSDTASSPVLVDPDEPNESFVLIRIAAICAYSALLCSLVFPFVYQFVTDPSAIDIMAKIYAWLMLALGLGASIFGTIVILKSKRKSAKKIASLFVIMGLTAVIATLVTMHESIGL